MTVGYHQRRFPQKPVFNSENKVISVLFFWSNWVFGLALKGQRSVQKILHLANLCVALLVCLWVLLERRQTICSSSDLKFISHSAVWPYPHYQLFSEQPFTSFLRVSSLRADLRLLSRWPHYWLNFRARQAACVRRMGKDWEREHSSWNYYSQHVLLSAPSAGCVVQAL